MIPQFSPLSVEHLPLVLTYARALPGRICDRTAGILYMWAEQLDTCLAQVDGMLLLRSVWEGRTVYACPAGEGDMRAAVTACRADAEALGVPLCFASITTDDAARIRAALGSPCTEESDDGWSDYLYAADALAALEGRAYHGPRNHINRFCAEYPAYRYTPLTPDQLPEVEEFYAAHRARTAETAGPSALAEAEAAARLLSLYPALLAGGADLLGGVLRLNGEIAGFSLGEVLGDTLFVHIEKANTAFNGVYPMLVREFARLGTDRGLRYINREEDDGHPGLRRSKQSYHPTAWLKKLLLLCP